MNSGPSAATKAYGMRLAQVYVPESMGGTRVGGVACSLAESHLKFVISSAPVPKAPLRLDPGTMGFCAVGQIVWHDQSFYPPDFLMVKAISPPWWQP